MIVVELPTTFWLIIVGCIVILKGFWLSEKDGDMDKEIKRNNRLVVGYFTI